MYIGFLQLQYLSLLIIHAHASGVQKAKDICEVMNVDAVLVGGKHYQALDYSDVLSAYKLVNCQESQEAVLKSVGGVFVHNIFIPKHGHEGTL